MRKSVSLVLLVLALAGCATTAKKAKEAETRYLLGVSFLQEQNPTKALGEFLKAAEADPQNPDIQAALGQAYQLKKAYPEAEKHYLRALKLRPGDPQIQNNLASLYLDMQRWDDAIRNFRLAADNLLFTRPTIALTGLGFAWMQKGDYLEAVSALKESLQLNQQNGRAHFLLGESYQALGRTDLAIQSYRQALVLAPDFAQGHFQLGLALMKQGQKVEASEAFQAVLSLVPGSDLGKKAKEYLAILN